MGDKTKIEWSDATLNPVRGCRRVSPGCEKCYAERLAATRLKHTDKYNGLAVMKDNGPRWTGEIQLDIETMKQALRWQKPRRIFVCDMSDLFYEKVPDEFIENVFAIMAVAQRHTFQILTKRADRMAEWFNKKPPLGSREEFVMNAAEHHCDVVWDPRGNKAENYYTAAGGVPRQQRLDRRTIWPGWPLPNVWIGISAENQETANQRIPHLISCPATVRYISYEPALGPLNLSPWIFKDGKPTHDIHWVIGGAESGPGARPCELDWMRSMRGQCIEGEIAFFLKQLIQDGKKVGLPKLDGKRWAQFPAGPKHVKDTNDPSKR